MTSMSDGSSDDPGTSKFVLFPVVSSILSSRTHLILASLGTVAVGGLSHYHELTKPIVVSASIVIYFLGLLAFEFGETGGLDPNTHENTYLMVALAVFIPVFAAAGYVGFHRTGVLSTAATGTFVVGGWYINRQLYNTMKEDIMDFGLPRGYFWLYISRVPYVGVVSATVVESPPFTAWVGVVSVSVLAASAYSVTRRLVHADEVEEHKTTRMRVPKIHEINRENIPENIRAVPTADTEPTRPDTEPQVDFSDETSEKDRPEKQSPTPVSGDTHSESDEITIGHGDFKLPDPADKANHDKAKEITLAVKDSTEQTNTLLDDRGFQNVELTAIPGDRIPPSVATANQVYRETQTLSDFLADHRVEDGKLRRSILDLQQHLQELDEFIYTEVGSDPDDFS